MALLNVHNERRERVFIQSEHTVRETSCHSPEFYWLGKKKANLNQTAEWLCLIVHQ